MYIASYISYVPARSSTKADVHNTKEGVKAKKNALFASNKLQEVTPYTKHTLTTQPNYSLKHNFLKQKESQKELDTFQKIKNYTNAKVAYNQSDVIFSLMQKPKSAIGSTKATLDFTLPKEAQKAKETLFRKEMINTYLENDNYYKITAA